MSDDPYRNPLEDVPESLSRDAREQGEDDPRQLSNFVRFWQWISDVGWGEWVGRVGTHILSLLLVLLMALVLRNVEWRAPGQAVILPNVNAAGLAEPTPTSPPPTLPPLYAETESHLSGVLRLANYETIIPTRPRIDIITYTVQTGDSVFGIAERFGLKPETILWGNYAVLADNPHRLQPGQVLRIPPVDGTLHEWTLGEDFRKVAAYYGVEPEAIIEYPGNRLDPYTFDIENPDIEPGTLLIVPGGRREYIDYGPPRIPRENPAVARTYGPGYCGEISEGAVGGGAFIWPANNHFLSGYDYNPGANHSGIDIDGETGDPIYAIDAGVVVYSGWSNFGYGNLIVIDHGNGWQSLYAHLNDIYTVCGQSVFQGTVIGTIGNTGNSSGSHLHFEVIYQGVKVNPWDVLP